MLDTGHDKPWEQGPGRSTITLTELEKIPGYHVGFLCWESQALTQKERSKVGHCVEVQETKCEKCVKGEKMNIH